MKSAFLSHRSLNALNRIGGILCPGDGAMPAFGQTGCLVWVDEVLAPSHPQDRRDLNILLWVVSWLPNAMLVAGLKWSNNWERRARPVQPLLRMLDIGLRGIVYTLYYSGLNDQGEQNLSVSTVHQAMGYDIHCDPDPIVPTGEYQ